jgi:esterase/lipase superfamily enzyme
MTVDEVRWPSPALDQEMALRVYGDAGRPLIAFPSQDGRYWDFEGFGMVEACAPLIEAGRVRIVAVDGVDWQSWTNQGAHPEEIHALRQAGLKVILA